MIKKAYSIFIFRLLFVSMYFLSENTFSQNAQGMISTDSLRVFSACPTIIHSKNKENKNVLIIFAEKLERIPGAPNSSKSAMQFDFYFSSSPQRILGSNSLKEKREK